MSVGSDRIAVSRSSGYVGIGTTDPQQRLHVSGGVARIDFTYPQLQLYNGDQQRAYLSSGVGDHLVLGNALDANLEFRTNNTTHITLSNTGELAIGTADPEERLHVFGNARIDNTAPFLAFYDGAEYKAFLYSWNNNLALSNRLAGNLELRTNSTTRMTINSTGDVGIGTPTPSAKLDVVGSAEIDGSTFYVDATSNRVGIGTLTPSAKLDVVGSAKIDGSTFKVDAASNRVGIGLSDPNSKLHVTGTVRIDDIAPQLRLQQGVTFAGFLQIDGASTMILSNKLNGKLMFNTNNLPRMLIANDGDVGIGIGLSNPENKLHVGGTIRIDEAIVPQLRFHQGATFAGFLQISNS